MKNMTFAALLLMSACGQDRNLNQYRTSQVEQELRNYRSIQGTYRGLAYQVGSKKPLGSVEIQLFANTVIDSDGLRSEPRPVLQSYVTLNVPGLNEIVISMDTGFYFAQEKRLKTSVNAIRNDTPRTIQLEGEIRGNSIEGLLSVFGFPSTALEVDVKRDDEWPVLMLSDYAKDRLPYVSARGKISYTGIAKYSGGRQEKVAMELRNNSVNSADMMIDLLSPVRVFTSIIDVSTSSFRLSFSNMSWDSEAGTLVGSQIRGGIQNVNHKLECESVSNSKAEGWDCKYTSSLVGILQGFEFRRPRNSSQEPR